ncbi:MAG TPA: Ig-like domain-containing protein, partial [Thermoplasmata archaeon]|nr:Ig-like domain-containing protein [Thermoplasmata archaeon]
FLFWNHTERFAPGEAYTVRIASSATSLDGAAMSTGYAFQFQVTWVTPWPKVSITAPGNNSGNVPLDIRVSVIFDQVMDPASTAAAFSMSPTAGGATTEVSGMRLYWNHTALLSPFTTYTGTVAASAKSAQGVSMIADYWFDFTTGTSTSPRPPEVSMTPADGAVGVGLNRSLVLSFTEPMNERSAERALSVAPAVGLGFIWDVDSKVLTVSPAGGWASSTQYTVSVSTSATSQAGESMRAPFESAFTTASGTGTGPVDPGTVSLLSTLGCAALIVILIVVGLLLFTRFRRQGGATHPAAPMPPPPVPTQAIAIAAPFPPPAAGPTSADPPLQSTLIRSVPAPPPAFPPPSEISAANVSSSRVPPPPPPPSSSLQRRSPGAAAEVPPGTISDWPEKEER